MSIWSYGFKNNQERVDFLKGLIDKYSSNRVEYLSYRLHTLIEVWREMHERYSNMTDDDILNNKKIEYLDIFGNKALSPFANLIEDDDQDFIVREKINFLNNKLKRLKISPIVHFFYGKNVQFRENIVLAYNDDKSVVIYSIIKGNNIEYVSATKYDHEVHTLKQARSNYVKWDVTSEINESENQFIKLMALHEAVNNDIDEDVRFYAAVNNIPISSMNKKSLSLKISSKAPFFITDAAYIGQNMPHINALSVMILDPKIPLQYDKLTATYIDRCGYVTSEEIHTLNGIASSGKHITLRTYLTDNIQNIHNIRDLTLYVENNESYSISNCSFNHIVLEGVGTFRFKNTSSSSLFSIYGSRANCIFENCSGKIYSSTNDLNNTTKNYIQLLHSDMSLRQFYMGCSANIKISDDSKLKCEEVQYRLNSTIDEISVITKEILPQNMTFDGVEVLIDNSIKAQGLVNILRSPIAKITARGSYGKGQDIATILNKYLAKGSTPRQRDIPGFEREMIEAGYEEYL